MNYSPFAQPNVTPHARFTIKLLLATLICSVFVAIASTDASAVNACTFTYPNNSSAHYADGIKEFHRRYPLAANHTNIRALINKHINLAENNYNTHIAGSQVKIYDQIPNVSNRTLLNTNLPTLNTPPSNTGQPTNFGNIRYHLSPRPFHYQQDEAYVDFANKQIMGGALSGGFVQEEIMMLTSNFLPIGGAVRARNYDGSSFCPNVSLKHLDTNPAVMYFRQFLELNRNSAKSIYGHLIHSFPNFNPDHHLQLKVNPVDIYAVGLAARSFSSGQHYAHGDIEAMTLAASRAFYRTMMAQNYDGNPIRIHTGNWGAGVFRNSHLTMWAIQRIAFEAAYDHFTQTIGNAPLVDYYYDAYSPHGVAGANDAHTWLAAMAQTHGAITVGQAIQNVFAHTMQDPRWDIRQNPIPQQNPPFPPIHAKKPVAGPKKHRGGRARKNHRYGQKLKHHGSPVRNSGMAKKNGPVLLLAPLKVTSRVGQPVHFRYLSRGLRLARSKGRLLILSRHGKSIVASRNFKPTNGLHKVTWNGKINVKRKKFGSKKIRLIQRQAPKGRYKAQLTILSPSGKKRLTSTTTISLRR